MQVTDHILSYHWRQSGIFEAAGIPKPTSIKTRAVENALLAEAYLVGRGDPERRISYSRSGRWWPLNGGRYLGTFFSRTTVLRSVDDLAKRGIIESEVAPSGPPSRDPNVRGTQSTFRLSLEFLEKIQAAKLPSPTLELAETVLLRRNGDLFPFNDTAHTRSIRRRLATLNEMLSSVTVAHPELGDVRAGDPIHIDGHFRGLARMEMHRVFTDTFLRHGRFYGPWWLGIPKKQRPFLTMDGEATEELDFPALHPTIIYALVGSSRELRGEPYEVAGVERKVAKIAFQIVINSDARHKAVFEMSTYLAGWKDKKRDKDAPRESWLPHHQKAEHILAETEKRHAPIAALFYSGLGLDLMSIDSRMAEAIMQRLMKRGVAVLPLHDGFRGQARHRSLILEEMAQEMEGLKSTLSRGWTREISAISPHTPSRLPSNPSLPSLPSGWVPTPDELTASSFFFLRDVSQLDMFGAHRLDVPTLDLFGWVHRRPCPSSVIVAVDHVLRRRRLSLRGLASQLGVSATTLSSVLRRRRLPSSVVVDGVRNLILSETETVGGFRRVV